MSRKSIFPIMEFLLAIVSKSNSGVWVHKADADSRTMTRLWPIIISPEQSLLSLGRGPAKFNGNCRAFFVFLMITLRTRSTVYSIWHGFQNTDLYKEKKTFGFNTGYIQTWRNLGHTIWFCFLLIGERWVHKNILTC